MTNTSIEALLDLQVIDKQRLALKQARLGRKSQLDEARKALTQAEEAAAAIAAQNDKSEALVRQYTADVARCDASIAELRAKQMNAKTNKEYMAIINGIEGARLEKTHREQSLKELAERIQGFKDKAKGGLDQVEVLRAKLAEVEKDASGTTQASPEEVELQRQYDERKAQVDPAFLEVYERLVTARHPRPLMKVDPTTRSTPVGAVISNNQVEQIRMGRLVIHSGTNSILYL